MDKKWIKVLETNKEDEILPYLKKKMDDNHIPYKMDLEEAWEGSARTPAYIAKFVVYVDSDFESKVEEIVYEYYKENELTSEEIQKIEELSNANYEDNEMSSEEIQKTEEVEEDETEIECKKIAKKRKIAIQIYFGIMICIIIAIIIAGFIN